MNLEWVREIETMCLPCNRERSIWIINGREGSIWILSGGEGSIWISGGWEIERKKLCVQSKISHKMGKEVYESKVVGQKVYESHVGVREREKLCRERNYVPKQNVYMLSCDCERSIWILSDGEGNIQISSAQERRENIFSDKAYRFSHEMEEEVYQS